MAKELTEIKPQETAAGTGAELAERKNGDLAVAEGSKPAPAPVAAEPEAKPRKKKGWPIGVRIAVWLAIVALVIFLTLFIVAYIVPDFNSIGDLIDYLVREFKAL